MKKNLALALMFVFTLAVFTPAIASAIDTQSAIVMLDDNKKDKKTDEKKATCPEKKEACTKAEKKACGEKSAATTDCSKKAETGCCAAKKAEKK